MARQFSDLPRAGQFYICAVTIAGGLVIIHSIASIFWDPPPPDWLVLAGLIVLTGSFSIKVPAVNARLSVSEAFVFTAVLLFGLHVGTVIVALDSLILTSWLRRTSRSPLRVLFNMGSGASAISFAARFQAWMLPLDRAPSTPIEEFVVPILVLATSYFLINSWVVTVAVAYDQNASSVQLWRRNFFWLGLNYLGGASVALVFVSYTRTVNLAAFAAIVPLLVVLYLTFRTSWGRIEDANKHVAQLNELYLSTIETLAMAVDAKDQITHGHIRRVQVFAVELAKRLGIRDDQHLKAIATAALLHDMGKLAIPEHILNKPGKLTAAEFEKMKRHADIGADLLSSVKFPYPVVPIVRHHHERWDGTGYPAGVSGTDIPLGARILAVVDCFDALTSDRPYRPRLSVSEAFTIIQDQRATTYDPLVVDTFIRAHQEIAPIALRAGEEAQSIMDVAEFAPASETPASLRQIRTNASEATLLAACSRDIGRATSATSALETSAQYLRQLTPGTVYALFLYDSSLDLLKCVGAAGDNQRLLDGLTIRLGERITGWVAANRRSSMNSDATLDLAQIAGLFTPPLRSTISTSLTKGDRLIGVLTAYTFKEAAFHEGHQYAFENIASALLAKLSPFQSGTPSNVVSFPRQEH